MKHLLLAAVFLVGCAHRSAFLVEPAPFVEMRSGSFSENLRDDRLLHSDLIVSGSIARYATITATQAKPFWIFDAELESREKIERVEVVVEQSSQGGSDFLAATIYQSPALVGRAKLPQFRVYADRPDATLEIYFFSASTPKEQRRLDVPLQKLIKESPNKSSQSTTPSVTPPAGQEARQP